MTFAGRGLGGIVVVVTVAGVVGRRIDIITIFSLLAVISTGVVGCATRGSGAALVAE